MVVWFQIQNPVQQLMLATTEPVFEPQVCGCVHSDDKAKANGTNEAEDCGQSTPTLPDDSGLSSGWLKQGALII